jgi:hypothetical protein
MSYWFRDVNARGSTAMLAVGALVAVAGAPAFAADVYFQPRGEVGAELNSNRDLIVSGPKKSSEGYSAEAGATIGIKTPLSVTTLKPQLSYTDYPDVDQNSLQGVMDFSSQYSSQRTQLGVFGRFDHRDTYNSELASAAFNPLNPNLPTTPETGQITVGDKRTVVTVVPNYHYALSERLGFGLSATYQSIDYSGTNAGTRYVPYDYYLGTATLGWALGLKSDMTVGVFASQTSDKDDDGESTATGATLAFNQRWTPLFSGKLELTVERDEITNVVPIAASQTSTNFGATYTTTWKGQISELNLSAGRTYTPGGSGGTYRADQLQVEYERQLSARLNATAAVRYIEYVSLLDTFVSGNYDYVNAVAGLKWKITPTWYFSGRLEYWREKFDSVGATANNNRVFIAFGYEGLAR